jgi:hypothetical protein
MFSVCLKIIMTLLEKLRQQIYAGEPHTGCGFRFGNGPTCQDAMHCLMERIGRGPDCAFENSYVLQAGVYKSAKSTSTQ